MKESEKLKELSYNTENDMKAWTYHWKGARAEREEYFLETILPKIKKIINVEQRTNGSYTIEFDEVGKVDFYPKSNKVLVRSKNRWLNNGLNFLVDNLCIELK
jgi:hypothetical protein